MALDISSPRRRLDRGKYMTAVPAIPAESSTSTKTQIDPYLATALHGRQQFTMLGDPDHTSAGAVFATHAFMGSDQTMTTFQHAGIRHLFMERPAQLQHFADDLSSGRITRDQFIEGMSQKYVATFLNNSDSRRMNAQTADIILNAKAHGIGVHFVDNLDFEKHPHTPEFKAYMDAINSQKARDKDAIARMTPEQIDKYEEDFGRQ